MPIDPSNQTELLNSVRTFLLDTTHPENEYIRANKFTASDIVISLGLPATKAALVGRALRALETEGLLKRRTYSGTYIYWME